ncbi:MAG: Ni/Fe-hydrogenase, b-type cytochrome subunit [Armatimonadota bacterium]|nr:Ni/Fe-hydrogenase, b-type cytochrome subunit [Armatimonadota bacterium]
MATAPLQRVYVWEPPVRLTHWVNVAAILVLSATGLYIGNPFLLGGVAVMTWMRAAHRIAAWVFVASLALRAYWAFVGNRWASWRALVPYLSATGRREATEMFLYYTFARRRPPPAVGHNALAGMAYSAVVLLMLTEVATGFALQSLDTPGWRTWLFGWIFSLASVQVIRLIHHLGMWLLVGFAIHHTYSAVLIDIEEQNGLISSIVSGYKFLHRGQ